MSEERAVSEALCRNNWSGYAAVCAEVCGDCSVPGQPHPCEHAMAVWGTDAQAILRALSSHAPNPAVERPKDVPGRLTALAGIAQPSADGFTYLNYSARCLLMEASGELSRLYKRLGPFGLEIVLIGEDGHYVSKAVKTEIELLRAAFDQLHARTLKAVERPADPRGWREALELAIKRLEGAAKCFRANDLKGLADNVDLDIRDIREMLADRSLSPAPKDREGG